MFSSAIPSGVPGQVSGKAAGASAAALCGTALGTFATATATTVEDMRSIEGGPRTPDNPRAYVFPNIFKAASPSDSAAWCWTKTGDRKSYEAWAVHAGDPPYRTGAQDPGKTNAPPSGPPGYA